MRLTLVIATLFAAAVAIGAAAGTASAKIERTPFDLDCGSDGTYTLVSYGDEGNSTWSPAHIVGTNRSFLPVAFSNVVVTVTDNDGNTEIENEPDVAKANAPTSAHLLNCHFTISNSFPGGTFSVEGDVVAYINHK